MYTVSGAGPFSGEDVSFDAIIDDLAHTGFSVIPGFFSCAWASALMKENLAIWEEGDFKKAAVGRGKRKQRRAEIRTDSIHWLTPSTLTPLQEIYWHRLHALREELNRSLFLGLFELEAHLARFSAGGYYKPHLDQHRKTSSRILSAITYLDDDWVEEDGGNLRLYTDRFEGVDGPFLDVSPEPGKLVLFLAADFWHEVRIARRPRHTITGWFRRREAPVPGVLG